MAHYKIKGSICRHEESHLLVDSLTEFCQFPSLDQFFFWCRESLGARASKLQSKLFGIYVPVRVTRRATHLGAYLSDRVNQVSKERPTIPTPKGKTATQYVNVCVCVCVWLSNNLPIHTANLISASRQNFFACFSLIVYCLQFPMKTRHDYDDDTL